MRTPHIKDNVLGMCQSILEPMVVNPRPGRVKNPGVDRRARQNTIVGRMRWPASSARRAALVLLLVTVVTGPEIHVHVVKVVVLHGVLEIGVVDLFDPGGDQR